MIRRLLISSLALGAAAALLLPPTISLGYRSYSGTGEQNCFQCHGDFRSGTPDLHDVHVGSNQMTSNCDLCHGGGSSFGDVRLGSSTANPDLSCTGCHMPDGLWAKHASVTDPNGLACADCHDPGTPLPEDTLPPYYSRNDVNVKDPCRRLPANGGEDWVGDGTGLDNDGDGVYDFEDEDCAGVSNQERTWGSVKSGYGSSE